jgi:hypothetical protein
MVKPLFIKPATIHNVVVPMVGAERQGDHGQ